MKHVRCRTYDDLVEGFKDQVVEIAEDLKDHGYFKSKLELSHTKRKFLRHLLKRKLPDRNWTRALYLLTDIVHKLAKREVIVLVDEHDTPMSEALRRGYLEEVDVCLTSVLSKLSSSAGE